MKTRDAYLFMNDQKETLLFVYLKMSKEQLQISLPISYEIDEKKILCNLLKMVPIIYLKIQKKIIKILLKMLK